MSKEILCTLGPSSMNDRVIARLEELGVSLFRINLSHTKLEDVAERIRFIQSRSKVPVCLDSEGAQIRTGDLATKSVQVRDNAIVRVHRERISGDGENFNLYPLEIVDQLEIGDLISIDFNQVLTQVVEKAAAFVSLRVLHGGLIGQNKAVTVERDIPMPPLTDKDREALEIGKKMGICHVALSFANRASDVDQIRAIIGGDVTLISKIESRSGLKNIDAITAKSNALLIDRGDLSRQLPIEKIPAAQKAIIKRGKQLGVKVYVATNLLESMISAGTPTRAEVNDIYNTLLDGADGLVLAAETAIGKYPVESARMVVKMIRELEANQGVGTFLDTPEPVERMEEPNFLTPAQARLVFHHKGWHRVIGVSACSLDGGWNPEEILQEHHADGFFLSSHEDLASNRLLKNFPAKVVYGKTVADSRYSNPQEAVLQALYYKDMGCSHILLNLRHPGISSSHSEADYRSLFASQKVGITPIFL